MLRIAEFSPIMALAPHPLLALPAANKGSRKSEFKAQTMASCALLLE
jgi:hypothetical protein